VYPGVFEGVGVVKTDAEEVNQLVEIGDVRALHQST
jgi:hypothetical protein